MWARMLVAVAALTGTAWAEFDASVAVERQLVTPEPARLRIGQPGDKLAFERISVAIQQDALGTTAQMTLVVATRSAAVREAAFALEVPTGARLSGVALTIGKTQRMVAVASGAEQARSAYQRVLEVGRDPILVEWRGEARTGQLLDVRAFPLTPKESGTIELTIELPEISALTIDASAPILEIVNAARTTTYRKPTQPVTIEVARNRELVAPFTTPRPHVSPTTSFYAGFAPGDPVPIVMFGGQDHHHHRPHPKDKREIRKEIKRHLVRLGWCWEKSVQFSGGPDAVANLHFFIEPSGKVTSASIDGTLANEAVTSCLLEVVSQFEFRPDDTGVLVNYPLSFRLAG